MLAQGLAAHEQPEVATRARVPGDVRARRGHVVGGGEDLGRRGDVVALPPEQEQRTVDAREVDPLTADLQRPPHQRVGDEQVLDDP